LMKIASCLGLMVPLSRRRNTLLDISTITRQFSNLAGSSAITTRMTFFFDVCATTRRSAVSQFLLRCILFARAHQPKCSAPVPSLGAFQDSQKHPAMRPSRQDSTELWVRGVVRV